MTVERMISYAGFMALGVSKARLQLRTSPVSTM